MTFLKQCVVASVMLCACGLSGSAQAAVLRSGDVVSVPEDAHIEGDFYAAGNDVHISGAVTGDVYVLGGTVTLTGPVAGDVVVLGGTVAIHGAVGDDVRVVGGKATLAGSVSGDVLVLGGSLTVLSTASVDGDVLFYGRNAEIAGVVKGAVHARGESLVVNASVGSVDAVLDGSLSLGSEADVQKDVVYESAADIARSPDAAVEGKVHHRDATDSDKGPIESRLTFWFMALFASLVAVFLFRGFFSRLFAEGVPHTGLCGFVGLGTLLITPLTFGLLLVSVLGALVGVFMLIVYIGIILGALVATHIFVGASLAKVIVKEYRVNWLWTCVGVVATQAALLIPIVGPLAVFAAFTIVLGMLVYHAYGRFYV